MTTSSVGTKRKFKAGDKVRILSKTGGYPLSETPLEKGSVEIVNEDERYGILKITDKNENTWTFKSEDLELIKEEEEKYIEAKAITLNTLMKENPCQDKFKEFLNLLIDKTGFKYIKFPQTSIIPTDVFIEIVEELGEINWAIKHGLVKEKEKEFTVTIKKTVNYTLNYKIKANNWTEASDEALKKAKRGDETCRVTKDYVRYEVDYVK